MSMVHLCASFALCSFVDVPFVMQQQMPKFCGLLRLKEPSLHLNANSQLSKMNCSHLKVLVDDQSYSSTLVLCASSIVVFQRI